MQVCWDTGKSSEQGRGGDTFTEEVPCLALAVEGLFCVYLSEISRPRPWTVSTHSATDADST